MICSMTMSSSTSPILSPSLVLSSVSTCSASAMLGLFRPLPLGICTWVGRYFFFHTLADSGTTVTTGECLFALLLLTTSAGRTKASTCLSLNSYCLSSSFNAAFLYFAIIVWLTWYLSIMMSHVMSSSRRSVIMLLCLSSSPFTACSKKSSSSFRNIYL